MSYITLGFNREQQAVALGIYNFYKNSSSTKEINWSLLRRNTHRLEKGLIMKPQKKLFALNYIEETVNEFIKIKEEHDNQTIKWTLNVLENYFSTVKLNNDLIILKERFDKHKSRFQIIFDTNDKRIFENEPYIPYERKQLINKIKYEDLLSLAVHRRSVRFFNSTKVENDFIDKALLVARQAPSACNRIPYKYIIFNDPIKAADIASIPFGTIGYSQQIPCLAVLVGDLSKFASSRDRHNIYVDGSLSAMNFIMALETLGLSSCCINWPDFLPLEIKMSKKLKLKKYERVIMLIAIGYPDKKNKVPYSKKKQINEVREFR
ncbi:nitroreductase family protein [Candidatus Pelagibacter bacterium]|nr:nitroreductase family protein [Candidatus Pelagibacter bacterium]